MLSSGAYQTQSFCDAFVTVREADQQEMYTYKDWLDKGHYPARLEPCAGNLVHGYGRLPPQTTLPPDLCQSTSTAREDGLPQIAQGAFFLRLLP